MLQMLFFAVILALTACSGEDKSTADKARETSAPESGQTQAQSAKSSASLQPSDPDLASLYQQSCFSCHGTGAGGAPRTGSSDWAPRLAQGMDVLLDHTINGFKGMPPLGLCMDCGEDEYLALITFMSGAE